MTPKGTKFLFGLSAFGFSAALVYGLGTGGDLIGVISAGYSGGVGEHAGYAILVALGVVAGALGVMMAAFRDADPASVAQIAVTESLPPAEPPAGMSYWPVIASFGVAILAVGAVVGPGLFLLGGVVLVAATFEWTVRAWSDRATGDPEVNRSIRNRLMYPIEIPAIALLVIGGVALGFSRVFLALPQEGATIAAMVAAIVVFGGAAVLATRPKINPSVVSGILLAGGLAVLVAGVVGAGAGERDFEEHGGEHTEETGDHGDEPVDEDGPGAGESGVTDEEGA